MLADIGPTGYEVGVLNGRVRPGDVVAVVGSGPIGLSAIMGSKLFSPAHIVAIDVADARLDAAKQFGADVTVNSGRADALATVRELTDGLGADVAIEAVGVPATFDLSQFQLEGDTYHGGGTFQLSSIGDDVFLTFTPVPEPGSLLIVVAAGSGMLAGVRRLRRSPRGTDRRADAAGA